MLSFEQHIFITGGSQGLGLALAELVASQGADVTICSRSKDKLEEAVQRIKVRCKCSRVGKGGGGGKERASLIHDRLDAL